MFIFIVLILVAMAIDHVRSIKENTKNEAELIAIINPTVKVDKWEVWAVNDQHQSYLVGAYYSPSKAMEMMCSMPSSACANVFRTIEKHEI